jgi:hypothetical protein
MCCAAALHAFLRPVAVGLVGQEELQRGQHESSEPTFVPVGAIEVSTLDHAYEELLREILRLIRRIATAAHVGIQRIPVAFTERNQRGTSFCPLGIGRGDDQRPSGGGEASRSWLRVERVPVRGVPSGHGVSADGALQHA